MSDRPWFKRLASAVYNESTTVYKIVRRYPSTLAAPLLLLALILGLGLFGIERASRIQMDSAKAKVSSLAVTAASTIEEKFAAVISPVKLLRSAVQYQPQFDAAKNFFDGVAADLIAEAPSNSIRSFEFMPSGVLRSNYPHDPRHIGVDVFNASVSPIPARLTTASVLNAVRDRRAATTSPYLQPGGKGHIISITLPIFVRVTDAGDRFGSPDPVNPKCGPPCVFNATTSLQFWGLVGLLVNVEALLVGRDSPRSALEAMGYHYRLESDQTAPETRLVVGSAGALRSPVAAGVTLLGSKWTLFVSPTGGWTPSWYGGAIAAVVVCSVAISGLLFGVLISWRKHQLLLQALLPKEVIKEMEVDRQLAELRAPVFMAETPAELLLGMLGGLMEGVAPAVKDIVLLRSALLRSVDFYQPLNLRGHIHDSNLDADVIHALLRQLASASSNGHDPNCHRRTSDGGLTVDDLAHPSYAPHDADAQDRSRRLSRLGPLYDFSEHEVPEVSTTHVQLAQHLCFDTLADSLAIVLAPSLLGLGPEPPMLPLPPAFQRAPVIPRPSRASATLDEGPRSDRGSLRSYMRGGSSTCDAAGYPIGRAGASLSEKGEAEPERHSAPLSLRRGSVSGGASASTSTAPGALVALDLAAARATGGKSGSLSGLLAALRSSASGGPHSASNAGNTVRLSPVMSTTTTIADSAFDRESEGKNASSSHKLRRLKLLQPPQLQLPPPPIIEEVERVLADVDNWCYDTWRLDEVTQGHALSALGFYLMQREGLIEKFRLNPLVLARLLRTIESGYSANPYHNATHAADVLQTLHVLIHGAQLQVHYLDRLGLLAAYFAAIVHDHGHPGLTNDFLVATSDPLAVRYNDRSPLENHHAASAFALMQRPGLDVLAPLTTGEKNSFRKQVIELVLATDMKQHFAILSHFNTVHGLASYAPAGQGSQPQVPPQPPQQRSLRRLRGLETAGTMSPRRLHSAARNDEFSPGTPVRASSGSEDAPRPADEAERLLSLQLVFKAADVGHLGEEMPVHERWLAGLEEEFFRQGDKEKALGLPISPLFDRAKQGVSKGQVGFYDFVALPTVHALSSAFPGAQPLTAVFQTNYQHWKLVEAKAQQ